MVMPVIKLFFNKKWQTTGMKKDITELYSFIDDFYQIYSGYEKKQLLPGNKQRNRLCSMSLSEIMTIMVMSQRLMQRTLNIFTKLV